LSPRGGARPGAGRRKKRLDDLVLSGGFRWNNRLHRLLLLEDDLHVPEADSGTPLRAVQARYRIVQSAGLRGDASGLAQAFEACVREYARGER